MIYIALGANLPSAFGCPRETFRRAILEMGKCGVRVLAFSPMYLTAPVPVSDQPWYHNAVIAVQTSLSSRELLGILRGIESFFGRVRVSPNEPRVLDLDILAYHNEIVNMPDLVIPHPRMEGRAFVLYPLRDIAPGWRHPSSGRVIEQLVAQLTAGQHIRKVEAPQIMGIVNVTPDSFSDGGEFFETDAAVEKGFSLLEQGADLLDVGGESTRPGAIPISPEEEQRRIIPVVHALAREGAVISVDTRHASTMEKALEAGAVIVNDITALTFNPRAVDVVKSMQCRVCLMHMLGDPQTMQENPVYGNVVREVRDYLEERIEFCVSAGIHPERLIADVGIGFGKTFAHNIELLRNLDQFGKLGVETLLGASRKRFIEGACGFPIRPEDRLGGSLAAVAAACRAGVRYVRVHDVGQTRQFIEVYSRLNP
ncbi:MAG: dihydropteroate synthase [Pseudobdellovibrionaceae bacterium]